jgi:hypothetical protein
MPTETGPSGLSGIKMSKEDLHTIVDENTCKINPLSTILPGHSLRTENMSLHEKISLPLKGQFTT